MRPDDKQGFSRFSIIIFFPCSLFYTVWLMGMLYAQLIIKYLFLLDFVLFKQRAVLGFHMYSFQDTIIVEKNPE